MAGIEADEFNALAKLLRATSAEAVPVAEDAAAQVYLQAAKSAAPRRTGQLQQSIKVIEGKPRRTLMGDTRNRLFVGPEKKKGYYGYFVEKGWTATGPKRRKRGATMTTHSQSGVTGGRKIPGRPWFEPAVRSADAQAVQAAEAAFNAKLRELDQRS